MSKPETAAAQKSRRQTLHKWRNRAVVTVSILAVFGVAAGIGHEVKQHKRHEVKAPTGAAGPHKFSIWEAGAPTPVIITIYDDLRSRASRDFYRKFEPTLEQMVATGQVHIQHRFVTGTDAKLGGDGAEKAANAAACAQDGGHFTDYLNLLWKNQPAEKDDHFADTGYLVTLGRRVHGLEPANFNPCVRLDKHHGWVVAGQRDFAASGLGHAPVLTINDVTVRPDKDGTTPASLRDTVRQVVKEAGADYLDSGSK